MKVLFFCFFIFFSYLVLSSKGDPNAPPPQPAPRLFSDVLKKCPLPNGLVLGNSYGCSIHVGVADSAHHDTVYIGAETYSGPSDITIGQPGSHSLSITRVYGKTITLGSVNTGDLTLEAADKITISSTQNLTLEANNTIDIFANSTTILGDSVVAIASSQIATMLGEDFLIFLGEDVFTIGEDFIVDYATYVVSAAVNASFVGEDTLLIAAGNDIYINSDRSIVIGEDSESVLIGNSFDNSETTLSSGANTLSFIQFNGRLRSDLNLLTEIASPPDFNGCTMDSLTVIGTETAGYIDFTLASDATGCSITVYFRDDVYTAPSVLLTPASQDTTSSGMFVEAAQSNHFNVTFSNSIVASNLIAFNFFVIDNGDSFFYDNNGSSTIPTPSKRSERKARVEPSPRNVDTEPRAPVQRALKHVQRAQEVLDRINLDVDLDGLSNRLNKATTHQQP